MRWKTSFRWRVLNALDVGNVNENKLVTMPHSKISYKLTQLTNVSSQYDTYISKLRRVSMKLLKRSIAHQVKLEI